MTHHDTHRRPRQGLLGVAVLAAGAILAGPAFGQGVLNGERITILGIGDPVFQVMQRIHGDLEEQAGGTIELDVKPFDVLRQQILLNAQKAESSVDLISIDLPQFGEYKAFLRDLTPLVERDKFDSSDFHRTAWNGTQHDGKILGIPIQPHPEILAYRKDLFDEAGLTKPKTTDDVINAAKTLHGSKGGLSGICWNGARGTALGQTFIQTLGSFGNAPIDLKPADEPNMFILGDIDPENMRPLLDTDAAHATAGYLLELAKYSPPGILNMAWDERVRVFAQGGCAMTYIWSGRSAIYELDENAEARGNVAYVPHPRGPDRANNVSTLGGWYLGIPTNVPDDRVDLAWEVIKWLTSPELMKLYTQHGNCVSPRTSVSGDPDVIARCPVIPYVDAMDRNGQLAGWQRPPVPELQQIVDVLGAEMHEMLAGTQSLEDAISKSQRQVDRTMQRAGYY